MAAQAHSECQVCLHLSEEPDGEGYSAGGGRVYFNFLLRQVCAAAGG